MVILNFQYQHRNSIVCAVYCPPNVGTDYFTQLTVYLGGLVQSNRNILILGDFNLPDVCWATLTGSSQSAHLFCEFLFRYNLTQMISSPTHVHGNIP